MLNYKYLHVCHIRRSGGFTLIDLLIVIAVVAILIALAVTPYQNYSIRAKVSECIMAAAPAKLSISEYRTIIQSWPPDAENASLNNYGVSEFCRGFVAYDPVSGSFQLNINESLLGGRLGQLQPQLTPVVTNVHTVSWKCSLGATAASLAKYLPSTCREV